MAIAQFLYGNPNDKLTAGQRLERGLKINSRPVDGMTCKFRTAYEVDLLPIEIESAALNPRRQKTAEAASRNVLSE